MKWYNLTLLKGNTSRIFTKLKVTKGLPLSKSRSIAKNLSEPCRKKWIQSPWKPVRLDRFGNDAPAKHRFDWIGSKWKRIGFKGGQKKPGPYQWEATFSRTIFWFTTQAKWRTWQYIDVLSILQLLLTELKRWIKVFFKSWLFFQRNFFLSVLVPESYGKFMRFFGYMDALDSYNIQVNNFWVFFLRNKL